MRLICVIADNFFYTSLYMQYFPLCSTFHPPNSASWWRVSTHTWIQLYVNKTIQHRLIFTRSLKSQYNCNPAIKSCSLFVRSWSLALIQHDGILSIVICLQRQRPLQVRGWITGSKAHVSVPESLLFYVLVIMAIQIDLIRLLTQQTPNMISMMLMVCNQS